MLSYNVSFNFKVNICSTPVIKLSNRQSIQKKWHVIDVNVRSGQISKQQVILSGCFSLVSWIIATHVLFPNYVTDLPIASEAFLEILSD